ncbi:hypothetical protein SAMN04488514_12216 [Kriegella aquimaris]|uniref:Lysylphosphatidylglycerol synthase TM region n=1 Tax=Kriegella aquimaris TaxID=192904 RepID=A0A1G9YCR4_9FLAO|nr:hypothetical protein SAMN04488514_12216 [Kriegella aquimaris]
MVNRKKLMTALKVVVSIALVYFIFTKINLQEIGAVLKRADPTYLVLALLLFTVSKIISAVRVNLYFHRIGIPLTQTANLKLAFLGMFYNLFFPGGIGGDAYKGYLLKKNFDIKTKRVVSVLVLDRLSGLLLLFIYACILALLLKNDTLTPFNWLFVTAIVLSVTVFWFLNKKFFPYVLPIFWKSFGFSALVQLAQLVSVMMILKALGIAATTWAYLFIFLISSIVAVLPMTIGGIGSREVTFFYGASLLMLDENTSVTISMIFFLMTALVSLFGVYFHFKKIALKVVEPA